MINISGAVNINTIGTTTTTIGNILSTTNISGNTINISGDLNINTGGTGNTNIGNYTGSVNTFASNTYIRTSVLYINSQENLTGFARIQLSNYGTYIYTDLNGYDTHRYRFFLRNVNNFEMNYVHNGSGNFMSRFSFTGNQGLGDFA